MTAVVLTPRQVAVELSFIDRRHQLMEGIFRDAQLAIPQQTVKWASGAHKALN